MTTPSQAPFSNFIPLLLKITQVFFLAVGIILKGEARNTYYKFYYVIEFLHKLPEALSNITVSQPLYHLFNATFCVLC